jgi:hypothetical protein
VISGGGSNRKTDLEKPSFQFRAGHRAQDRGEYLASGLAIQAVASVGFDVVWPVTFEEMTAMGYLSPNDW